MAANDSSRPTGPLAAPLWRHGDVLIAVVSEIPPTARKLPHRVLAEGEITGHAHRISESGTAEVFEQDEQRFLSVGSAGARVVHEEHAPIDLPPGEYRVWIQREYTPEEIRRVLD